METADRFHRYAPENLVIPTGVEGFRTGPCHDEALVVEKMASCSRTSVRQRPAFSIEIPPLRSG